MRNRLHRWPAFAGAAVMLCNAAAPAFARDDGAEGQRTATPIKHLVVIYNENVSFDHYFATYPVATNPPGEPEFHAAPSTPWANTLVTSHLLTNNPNLTNTANSSNAAAPFRLDRSQAATADQNHGYTAEQLAEDGGKADLFPLYTGASKIRGQVMGYYDGNTVTALWNYAQHFAMSDNSYSDAYGPSTPGALEAVSGQTNGVTLVVSNSSSYYIPDGQGGYTLISDTDPGYDVCSSPNNQVLMTGRNIGDLLNAANISWGGFMGGFNLQKTNPNNTTGCARSTVSPVVGSSVTDYIPHHNWFQYYPTTANPTHARPSSVAAIGHTYTRGGAVDPANHQYDLEDFYAAVEAGNFPAVSYLKSPAFQDGHAGYSDPLDEQTWIATLVNFLEQRPEWRDTAVIVAYDDSDGWYDHAFAPVESTSYDYPADQLDGAGYCGNGAPALPGLKGLPVNGRCGPGMRQPFLVISPYSKRNYVSHARITQASIVRFIEDNWLHGQRLGGGSFDATAGSLLDMFDFGEHERAPRLFLNTSTGEIEDSHR